LLQLYPNAYNLIDCGIRKGKTQTSKVDTNQLGKTRRSSLDRNPKDRTRKGQSELGQSQPGPCAFWARTRASQSKRIENRKINVPCGKLIYFMTTNWLDVLSRPMKANMSSLMSTTTLNIVRTNLSLSRCRSGVSLSMIGVSLPFSKDLFPKDGCSTSLPPVGRSTPMTEWACSSPAAVIVLGR